jgi:hypothetical protein
VRSSKPRQLIVRAPIDEPAAAKFLRTFSNISKKNLTDFINNVSSV